MYGLSILENELLLDFDRRKEYTNWWMPRTCVESLCDHTRPSTVNGTRRLIDLHNITYGVFHKVNAIIINNKLYITIVIIIIIQAVMVVAAITRIQFTRIYRRYQKFWECCYLLGFSERGVPCSCIEIVRDVTSRKQRRPLTVFAATR